MGGDSRITLSGILDAGLITDEDVRLLRHAVYVDGRVTEQEAEALFAIDRNCEADSEDWCAFFVEALADFVVYQVEPRGYVTVENADWLIAQVLEDAEVGSLSKIELLIHVLEMSRWSPDRLMKFTLDRVKMAVLSGKDRLSSGALLRSGIIGEAEVDLLRRILYAAGGDGNVAITRAEAEVLFDINDATTEADNDPSWSDLFAKAIANHLLAAHGYKVPDRDEALRRERWLDERDGTLGFMQNMLSSNLREIWEAYGEQTPEERELERLETQKRAIITAEKLTEPEADWLIKRIGRDGAFHENERALLAFVSDECPNIASALAPLMARCFQVHGAVSKVDQCGGELAAVGSKVAIEDADTIELTHDLYHEDVKQSIAIDGTELDVTEAVAQDEAMRTLSDERAEVSIEVTPFDDFDTKAIDINRSDAIIDDDAPMPSADGGAEVEMVGTDRVREEMMMFLAERFGEQDVVEGPTSAETIDEAEFGVDDVVGDGGLLELPTDEEHPAKADLDPGTVENDAGEAQDESLARWYRYAALS